MDKGGLPRCIKGEPSDIFLFSPFTSCSRLSRVTATGYAMEMLRLEIGYVGGLYFSSYLRVPYVCTLYSEIERSVVKIRYPRGSQVLPL